MSTSSTASSLSSKVKALAKDLGSQAKTDHSLSEYTWMKVGGTADVFYAAQSVKDLKNAVELAIKHDIPFTIFGGGSNVLIKDKGIRGLVIRNRADKITLAGIKGNVVQKTAAVSKARVKADSGVVVNQLVRYTIEESLEGLEEFLGIPGTVGGATYNNSHHLDHLIGDYIVEVEVIDSQGKVKNYSQEEMKFAYDYSILQKTKDTILTVTFELKPGDKKDLWQKATAALKRRRDTQPLEKPSSGCMFKNIGKANAITHNTPNHTTSAGFLIDKAGLKGRKVGGAMVSEKHANFIVNAGGATAQDIVKLSKVVKDEVKQKFGVTLEAEVFFIGEK